MDIKAIRREAATRLSTLSIGDDDLIGYPYPIGLANVPAAVVELDAIDYDLTMGRGADSVTLVVTVLVSSSADITAQELLDDWISTAADGLKAAIEGGSRTWGGLVSYANLTSVRKIGMIPYGGLEYLGAELTLEVVA